MCREAETMTTTKKKKGRPSLLEIQKRNLKQQQQHQDSPSQSNPNSSPPIPNARSTRRNPTLDSDESRPKRHRTLNSEAALNMPTIASSSRGSDPTEEKILRATDTNHVSLVESGPITPLPDKKLLVFILDRLQKKDTHGVFSEPVDPEELPDYHDIIEHPMDFGTVRRKLDEGAYSSLEQFEKDIFLICSNAMEYNATNTVFFRQARSIQELAKKDFDNLRQDSDDSEPQPKVARRGRPPGKNLKRLLGSSSAEPVGPELSDATLGTGGDNGSWPKTYNLRKIHTPDKVQLADTPVRATLGSHNSDTYSNYLSEWENEFPASVLKAVLKYGKKSFTVDENRRESYKLSLASENGASVLNTLKGESKQLIAVGLQTEEHGYSRSLAQFAADLGPRVWKIASKKISSILPNGVKFGPGWVGENDMPVGKQQCMNDSLTNDHIGRVVCPNTSSADRCVADAEGAIKGLNSSVNGTVEVGNRPRAHQIQQDPGMSSFPPQAGMGRAGTSTGHLGLDETSMGSRMQGMNRSSLSLFHASNSNVASTRFPHGGAVYGKSPWQGLGMSNSPDLNIRSMEPGSKLQSGSSQQQPDLALQL